MKQATKQVAALPFSDARYSDLKRMLEDRRKEVASEILSRIRDQRGSNGTYKCREAMDSADVTELDTQGDIEFALIQMKEETLTKINDALLRLEEGSYGYCSDCGGELSDKRLRALPFAVRCKDCEEGREMAVEREKVLAQKRKGAGFFFDTVRL